VQVEEPVQVEAAPSRAAAVALLLLAVVLVVVATQTDATGTLLAAPAAVVALGLGLRDLLLVPVLRADATGLVVVHGLRRQTVAWSDVRRLRVVDDRRSTLLELDLEDDVVLLSRGRLGRDPRAVLDELQALRA
jgi:hypothetical protein